MNNEQETAQQMIEYLHLAGMADEKIARHLDVSLHSVWRWRNGRGIPHSRTYRSIRRLYLLVRGKIESRRDGNDV